MRLADELKDELDIEKALPNLRDSVKAALKNGGCWMCICDRHVGNRVSNGGGFDNTVADSLYYRLIDWARAEGLRPETRYNSYGVRSVRIYV